MKAVFPYLVLMGAIMLYLFGVSRGMRNGIYYKLPRAYRIVGSGSLIFLVALFAMAIFGSLIAPHQ